MLHRRMLAWTAVAALSAAGAPMLTGAHAAAPVLVYPKAGCFDLVDPSGDSHPDLQNSAPTDPDLDILGVAFRSTATDFQAYIKVNRLAAGPETTDGHRYTVTFVLGDHIFSLAGSSYAHGTGAIREALASQGKAGHTNQMGVDTPPIVISASGVETLALADRGYKTSGLNYTWNTTGSWVVMDVPIADIAKYAGVKFAGKLQSVGVFSATDEYAVSSTADTTESGNGTSYTYVWTVGSNKCWPQPKPAPKKKSKKH